MRKILLALSALCLVSAAAQPPAKPAPVAKPALWKIADADTTIYLFGTIHVLKPETQWFTGTIVRALESSDDVVLEILEPDPADAKRLMIQGAMDPDGPPLSQKLSPKDAQSYQAALLSLGIPPASLETFEPWFAAIILSITPLQKLGYEGDSGAERTLTRAAKQSGKRISALETLEQQLGYFDKLPEAAQIALLNESVASLATVKATADSMTDDWTSGNVTKLAETMNEGISDNADLTRVLLIERNQRWAEWVAKRMEKPGVVFMAVGAAHLAGDKSVQSMLAAKKLKAVRVN